MARPTPPGSTVGRKVGDVACCDVVGWGRLSLEATMLTLTLTLTLTCQHRSCARTATMRPAGRSLSTRCTHCRAAVAEAGSKWQVPQRKTSTAPQRTLASRLGVGGTFAAAARRTCDEKHARRGAGQRGPSG